MKYDYNTLVDFCKEHNVTLCEDYSNIILKRETLIKGICKTENCDNPFTKGFRALLNPNGYCMSCAKIFGKEKAKQTNMEKYGVEHSTQSKEVKDKIKASVLKNYGVEHISHCKEIKDKTKKTCLEKYGVEAPSQSKEIMNKMKQTNLEKYGVENYLQTNKFKDQYKATCLEKYGVEYISQSKQIKEKIKSTCLQKYGVTCTLHSEENKEKIKKTWINKYGVDSPNQSEEVKEKKKETCMDNYGVEYPTQNSEIMEKSIKTSYKSKEYIFPSGRIDKIQGYEHYALDELIINEKMNESDIITGCKNVPTIWYSDDNNIKHRHYVDIFIPTQNMCIEVKSTWTAIKGKNIIFLKQAAAKELGYKYEIWVYNDKGIRVEKYE
jgi:hypothetical protein